VMFAQHCECAINVTNGKFYMYFTHKKNKIMDIRLLRSVFTYVDIQLS